MVFFFGRADLSQCHNLNFSTSQSSNNQCRLGNKISTSFLYRPKDSLCYEINYAVGTSTKTYRKTKKKSAFGAAIITTIIFFSWTISSRASELWFKLKLHGIESEHAIDHRCAENSKQLASSAKRRRELKTSVGVKRQISDSLLWQRNAGRAARKHGIQWRRDYY